MRMKKADSFLLCKVVSFAYTSPLSIITFTLLSSLSAFVCVYSTVAACQLLTSQVSQRPQQASVVMCRPPQPGFLARKVNSRTAQPVKRSRLTADTWRSCGVTQIRSSSSSQGLLMVRSRQTEIKEKLNDEMRKELRDTSIFLAGICNILCFYKV